MAREDITDTVEHLVFLSLLGDRERMGYLFLVDFVRHGIRTFRPCVSVYLGVHVMSFLRIYVRGVEISMSASAPQGVRSLSCL